MGVDPTASRTLRVTTRRQWRLWLAKNHARRAEIWLVYAKRHTGRPRIAYEDAVEEALCFGWIDGLVRRLDEHSYARRFTPRRPGSQWSDLNRRRFAKLVDAGLVAHAGLARAPSGRGRVSPLEPSSRSSGERVPRYMEDALKRQAPAWRNFLALAPSYRRLYVRWVQAAVREETRRRRLEEATALLVQNKKLGLK